MSDKPVEKRGRPKGTGGNKRPDRKEAMSIHVEPGDNSRFLSHTLAVAALPEIDTTDAKQVETRINEYMQLCVEYDMKPTVSGCALAIGVDRSTFNRWCSGVTRSDSHCAPVKKAHELLDTMMENYMMNGKINPVAGIFLMKNNHGYTDQQEITIKPDNPLGDTVPTEELQQKYLEGTATEDPDD